MNLKYFLAVSRGVNRIQVTHQGKHLVLASCYGPFYKIALRSIILQEKPRVIWCIRWKKMGRGACNSRDGCWPRSSDCRLPLSPALDTSHELITSAAISATIEHQCADVWPRRRAIPFCRKEKRTTGSNWDIYCSGTSRTWEPCAKIFFLSFFLWKNSGNAKITLMLTLSGWFMSP